jgi:hypothetical protein
MKPEIKAIWIAALRNGEYTQTTGTLRNDQGYCCLGVLCDLHAKAGLGEWEDTAYDNTVDLLPDIVALWAGTNECPDVNDIALVDLNDGVNGYTQRDFKQIADLIEEFL